MHGQLPYVRVGLSRSREEENTYLHRDGGMFLTMHELDITRFRTRRGNVLDNAGVLTEVGLLLEAYPHQSLYINKLAGRAAVDSKLHLTRQASFVLVAHKTSEFTCLEAAPQLEPPRTRQLEAIGVVVSQKHPPSTTFLAPAMADYLMNRCAGGEQLLGHGWLYVWKLFSLSTGWVPFSMLLQSATLIYPNVRRSTPPALRVPPPLSSLVFVP